MDEQDIALCEKYHQLMDDGLDPDEAAKQVAVQFGMAKSAAAVHWSDMAEVNDLYDQWLNKG